MPRLVTLLLAFCLCLAIHVSPLFSVAVPNKQGNVVGIVEHHDGDHIKLGETFESGTMYSAVHDSAKDSWKIEKGKPSKWVAWSVYQETRQQTGWDVLDVASNPKESNEKQAFAAGFIEGALTHKIIWDAWNTYLNGTLNFTIPDSLANWLTTNDKWIRNMVENNTNSNDHDEREYWKQVRLVLAQFDGLQAGYNQYAPQEKALGYLPFLIIEASGDLSDIKAALGIAEPKNYKQQMYNNHCSGLVKLTPDGNLFTSHVTWTTFMNLLRVYKHYHLPYSLSSTKATRMSFSSVPGYLPSGDDFYITDSNLVILETTNSVMNMSLYQYVTPETVLYWVRNNVANRMSSNGQDWARYFAKYNSGTYNNQWMIVDYKLFSPGKPLQPNTLWVAEQIPGYVVSSDETSILKSTGYWASYNIPFFPFVYNISGYPAAYKQYGNGYSYSKCPRAQIFARDHSSVTDMETMKTIMRYNKWQTDPLSLGDACNSISARCDLNPPSNNPSPFGGVDAKITDHKLVKSLESKAVSSPTWDSQPIFAWTHQWDGFPHYGQPDTFAFGFESMKPYRF